MGPTATRSAISATYAYDFANRLISTTLSGTTTQFAYNGDGIRLRLIEAGTLTTYTQDYAAPLPVVLQARTGATSTQYVYSLGTRPIAEYEAAAWEYLLADPLGSVRQIANSGGNVTLLKSYEPYGSVLNSQGSATSMFGYTGEQTDTYIKLVFLRARYYSPDSGRFLSKDVWHGDYTRPLSLNGWSYVEGDPISRTDPSGKITIGPLMSKIGSGNPQGGTSQFGIMMTSIPLEILNQLNGLFCRESSTDQPFDTRGGFGITYSEGAAAVFTVYFGTAGAWAGAETVYNLATRERVTFDVRGTVIARASIIGLGAAAYAAFSTGAGLSSRPEDSNLPEESVS